MKKLFALLCVIALLGALCVPAMADVARVPVAADVPDDWTTAYLYAWNDTGSNAAWPGVPMTEIDGWFVAYMNDDNSYVIINNGTGSQTADLSIDPGLPVCVMADRIDNASVEFELPIEVPAEDKMPKPATDKIYALVPDSWTTVNLYAWTADASGNNAGWPGVPMTKGDNGLWVGELNPGYANVIVNDGTAQTVDLPYNGGDAWVLLTAEATNGGKFEASVLYEDPGTYAPPTNPVVPPANGGANTKFDVAYVAGTMNGWTNPDEAYKMTDNGDGTFSLTFFLTAGAHALKVTNGTWDVSFGGNGADGNLEFGMTADGEITVNYDGNGGVTVTGDNIGEAPSAPAGVWYVAGTMNDWNCADESYKMTDNGDGTYSYTFAAIPGDYALKVTNGTWDVNFGGDGADGNYEFNVADECNVVVKFDGSTVSHEFTSGEIINENTNNSNNTNNTIGAEDEGNEGGNSTMIIAIVATAVILIGGGVAVFFLLKKKD